MIRSLTVKNFALASSLSLEFGEKLNILSGETGAGKSILIDCIMLLTGGKYDKTMLRYGTESGFVEGVFSLFGDGKAVFADYLEDGDEDVIITRKFNADGRNDIKVNGRSVTLSSLKKFDSHLLDVCGQNEHQSLAVVANHIKTVDYFARKAISEPLESLNSAVSEYRETLGKIEEIGDAAKRERDLDVYKFRLAEIDKAKVKEGEEDELVAARKKLLSSEKVMSALSASANALGEDEEGNVAELLSHAIRSIQSVAQYDEKYSSWAERLHSVAVEADDVLSEIEDETDSLDFSDDALDKIEKRLEVVRNITRKYGDAKSVAAYREELVKKIDEVENADELFEKLVKRKKEFLDRIYELSRKISEERKAAALKMEKSVMSELGELGMPQAVFKVEFSDFPDRNDCEKFVSAKGMDAVEFYLSPNLGQPLKPLVKIISGGELSRLMLALKVVSSGEDDVPTVIFDEIDTGISGKVGQEVAKKLARLSRTHQLLCVTHLPQIAAMADAHFFIDKYTADGQTYTRVRELDENEKIGEIARLSGGRDITAQAETNAAELKEWCDNYKKSL